jgi:hypothetical protein
MAASMKWVEENDPESLFLHFAVDEEVAGVVKQKLLRENGERVTQENKKEYLKALEAHLLHGSVPDAYKYFRQGLELVIPSSFLKQFTVEEMQQQMSGMSIIDSKDRGEE